MHKHQQRNDLPANAEWVKNRFADYTRQHALDQGFLFDVTPTAKRLHYPCAVAMSHSLFEQCVKWDHFATECQIDQNQAVRLSTVLIAAKAAARVTLATMNPCHFGVQAVPKDGYSRQKKLRQLRMVFDQDAQHQPALTIMLAHDLYQALLDFARSDLNEVVS